MAKTYDGNGDAQTSGPTKSSESPVGKFIPIIVGLIVLAMVIGLVIRSNSTWQTVPGATSDGGAGVSNPAARPNGTFPATR